MFGGSKEIILIEKESGDLIDQKSGHVEGTNAMIDAQTESGYDECVMSENERIPEAVAIVEAEKEIYTR